MTPTKLLIGQILVVLGIIVAGIWIATQWAAASLAYQPELGAPWFTAFGQPNRRHAVAEHTAQDAAHAPRSRRRQSPRPFAGRRGPHAA